MPVALERGDVAFAITPPGPPQRPRAQRIAVETTARRAGRRSGGHTPLAWVLHREVSLSCYETAVVPLDVVGRLELSISDRNLSCSTDIVDSMFCTKLGNAESCSL